MNIYAIIMNYVMYLSQRKLSVNCEIHKSCTNMYIVVHSFNKFTED